MTGLVSTATKIKQVEGLLGTSDLTAWETNFVQSILERAAPLTDRQLEALDRIWGKHFA